MDILAQLDQALEGVVERPANAGGNINTRFKGSLEAARDLLEELHTNHGWELNIRAIQNSGYLSGTKVPAVSVAAKSMTAPGVASGNFRYHTQSWTLIVTGTCPVDPTAYGFTAL